MCTHYHGGFHLCVGSDAPKELKKSDTIYGPYSQERRAHAALGRWGTEWERNKVRDKKIHDAYMDDGWSLKTCAQAFKVDRMTVKSIVERLGGEIRPRNVGRYTHKKKENS